MVMHWRYVVPVLTHRHNSDIEQHIDILLNFLSGAESGILTTLISLLQMSRLLAWPRPQHQWYKICRINWSLHPTRKAFKYLLQLRFKNHWIIHVRFYDVFWNTCSTIRHSFYTQNASIQRIYKGTFSATLPRRGLNSQYIWFNNRTSYSACHIKYNPECGHFNTQ